jgi:hypothetical protein
MKTFFAFSALALSQSAYALKEGTYTIGSAILEPSQVLTEIYREDPLIFSEDRHNAGQVWIFYPTHDGYFQIRNKKGGRLNCPGSEGSPCIIGDELQGFLPEFVGGNSYEIVVEGSGLLLWVEEDQQLYVDFWNQTLSEQFVLTAA